MTPNKGARTNSNHNEPWSTIHGVMATVSQKPPKRRNVASSPHHCGTCRHSRGTGGAFSWLDSPEESIKDSIMAGLKALDSRHSIATDIFNCRYSELGIGGRIPDYVSSQCALK